MFLEISQNLQETPVPESQAATFLQNTFFTEHLWKSVSKSVTEIMISRSSRSQMFFKIGVLKNFAILETLFNNKVAGLLLTPSFNSF